MPDANPLKSLGRRPYAWMMVFLIAGVPAIQFALIAIAPATERYLEPFFRPIGTATVVCIALFTGARLVDAGYRRWIGITLTFAIMIAIPAIAGVAYAFLLRPHFPSEPFFLVTVGVTMIALVLFVIWAGTRRSVPRAAGLEAAGLDDGLGTRNEARRIEPHF